MFDENRPGSSSSVEGYQVEYWLSEAEISSAPYSDYWNDEQIEKRKAWHVQERGFSDLNRHLEATGLAHQLQQCLDTAARLNHPVHGIAADLACGILWTTPLLLNAGSVEKLYCVEYSKHRLLQLGPGVLQHYHVPPDKVVLCLGSFYDLHLPDRYLDFVVLAEAFHHADNPGRLLAEIRRVLKPDGVVLILGEHLMPHEAVLYGKHFAKYIVSHFAPARVQRRLFGGTIRSEPLFPSLQHLLRPDPVTGDHYYLVRQYEEMFSFHGFNHERITTAGCPFQAFVLLNQTKRGK